ncbi:oligosaccharide flippase family protein [Microbacterium invictum]|uniref:O-antigen/teichoic acid export membrane protein n=1 Tax=Microbacterium invictum TaxID=515415 RepID=A0AA40VM36_9MICO|nr:lipopolysaccharide biosynthesis protein [Microbacterium invictum]MBB4140039.1 O-antigen/teichoic acid export membrane protein [Microbacterium invictum]
MSDDRETAPSTAESWAVETAIVASIDTDATVRPQTDVGRAATGGVLWLTAQKWVVRLFSFVTIAILTRLLAPEDFGTLAAASTVLPFFYLLADLGFAAYIVQVAKTTERMLSTAFWFSLVAGIVLCGLLWLGAPLMGQVFGNETVAPVLQALSIWVVITAVGSVPTAIVRRQMRFAVIAAQGAAAAVIAQIVALILAFTGFGVWALVAQTLVGAAVSTILIWVTAGWRPRWSFAGTEFGRLSTFGGKVLGVEFVAMTRAWGEAAITSAVLGAAALGFMSVAQRLVQIVQDLTGSAIVPVTNVAFAKVRESAERLRSSYLRALRLVYLVLSLPLTLVAVAAPLIVPILFGAGWSQSIPVAQVLALAGTLSVAAWLDHGLFYGIGKPGTWFVYALVTDAVTLATTMVTARWGLVAIATGFLGVATVATVARWFLVGRALSVRPKVLLRPFLFLISVVAIAGGAGWGTMMLTAQLPGVLALVLVGLTVTIVHLAVSLLTARPVLVDAISMVARTRLGARLPLIARIGGQH